ncbi:MAG: hypothetical protein A2283_17245 [Lentisphaerae bacterium RIFOXYA12_FULL_48_11]|nr:MAG: hypothetical protein A2283_17245 [Lentisphaerae bacterium RIFOXYA12_FULL_48_11]
MKDSTTSFGMETRVPWPVNVYRLLSAMFLLGIFSAFAQIMFFREVLVVFLGNELVIGLMLAGWLVGISSGALLARLISARLASLVKIDVFLVVALFLMAMLLPFQIYTVRTVRFFLDVPAFGYVSFWSIVSISFFSFLPTCFGIGLIFPFASEIVGKSCTNDNQDAASAVSRVYFWESLGSMFGGIIVTFVFLPWFSPLFIIVLTVSVGCLSAAVLAPDRNVRHLPALVFVCTLLVVPLYPKLITNIEERLVDAQWRSFGALGGGDESEGTSVAKLKVWRDSVYQNLAVIEVDGQFSLYANGRVTFVFPDQIGYEHSVHFVMAQNPQAKTVLLVGGNPVGDIPELLKYPMEKLVYVEIDPEIGRLVEKIRPREYDLIRKDARLTIIHQDAPKFVQLCQEKYDIVLVNAPEPATAAANRFYTYEFYRNISRILSDDGFMFVALGSSERLQSESADLGASVYKTIRLLFAKVLVTAETQKRFIAGNTDSDITFDRKTLFERSKNAAISNKYFQSQYFLGADEIDPAKIRLVEEKFASADVHINTNLRPITYFYNLLLWNRFSGSGVESLLDRIRTITIQHLLYFLATCALLILMTYLFIRLVCRRQDSSLLNGGWVRSMSGFVLATTGFCGMGLEVILLFIFQSIYGYVYSMVGLIVACFMMGLVLGAVAGRYLSVSGWVGFRISLVFMEVMQIVCALAIPGIAMLTSVVSGSVLIMRLLEVFIYMLVAVIGCVVGAEFPLVNKLYSRSGVGIRSTAAITDAADHLGAAVGAISVGVILVPVLGVCSTCIVIVGVKILGLISLVTVFSSSPKHLE